MEPTRHLATTSTAGRAPAPPDPSSTRSLSLRRNALNALGHGGFELSDRLAPSAEERAGFELRRRDLSEALGRADIEAAQRRIAKLFGMMPSANVSEINAAGVVADYAKVMSSQPLWAIDAACVAVIDSGTKFRPGVAEFLAMAKRATASFREELAGLTAVLGARIYHEPYPNERGRVMAGFDEALAKLTAANDMARACATPKRADWAGMTPGEVVEAMTKRNLADPVVVSDLLLASVGRKRAPGEASA